MTINWTAISTIIEIIGVIIVVLSLFYVARQVQQNTKTILTSLAKVYSIQILNFSPTI